MDKTQAVKNVLYIDNQIAFLCLSDSKSKGIDILYTSNGGDEWRACILNLDTALDTAYSLEDIWVSGNTVYASIEQTLTCPIDGESITTQKRNMVCNA